MLFEGQMTKFHMCKYLSFLPIAWYSTGFGFLIISQATLLKDKHIIVGLKEWKVVGRKTQKSSFALFAAISQVF